MTVKYINSKNEVLEFIGADILPTSGYLHQRKWNTNKENDITVIDKGDCTYTITLTLKGSLEPVSYTHLDVYKRQVSFSLGNSYISVRQYGY